MFVVGLLLGAGVVYKIVRSPGSEDVSTSGESPALFPNDRDVSQGSDSADGDRIAGSDDGSGDSSGFAAADLGRTGGDAPPATPAGPDDLGGSRRTAIVEAAERVGSAVVSISVTQVRMERISPFAGSPNPFERYFSRFYPGQQRPHNVSSLGSGVIIDTRGVVVTNEHVVRDAQEINVTLPDGRMFDAAVVGVDRAYDLAVLRIQGEDLPVADVGDSDGLLVGEWAICLGNPFGFLLNDYKPTVSVGVISAVNRDVKPDGETDAIYKDMIQTDAAINPGNSGGPLVDSAGQVIGINTFIFSTGGGSLGIGFAIPINTVVRVAREILEYGRVRQVWIGIRVQEITQMVANYFQIRDKQGLLVWGIEEGSPAAEAGIKVGDIIRSVNRERVTRATQAQRLIFGATIGDTITLTLERDGDTWDAELLLVENPSR